MFDKIKNRKDYLSVDKLTAISAEGVIFHVGDIVYHERDTENKPETIQKFKLDIETKLQYLSETGYKIK